MSDVVYNARLLAIETNRGHECLVIRLLGTLLDPTIYVPLATLKPDHLLDDVESRLRSLIARRTGNVLDSLFVPQINLIMG